MVEVTSTVSGVIPKYVYNYSDALHVQTRCTVAYQATCRCGYEGRWRSSRAAAMDDYQEHKLEAHGSTD